MTKVSVKAEPFRVSVLASALAHEPIVPIPTFELKDSVLAFGFLCPAQRWTFLWYFYPDFLLATIRMFYYFLLLHEVHVRLWHLLAADGAIFGCLTSRKHAWVANLATRQTSLRAVVVATLLALDADLAGS